MLGRRRLLRRRLYRPLSHQKPEIRRSDHRNAHDDACLPYIRANSISCDLSQHPKSHPPISYKVATPVLQTEPRKEDAAEDPESWDDSKLNKPVKFIYDDDGTEEYFDGDAHGALLVFGAVVLSTLATVGGLIWLFKKAFKG